MQIPEHVKLALRAAPLTAADWRRVQIAFETIEAHVPVPEEVVIGLCQASHDLTCAERLRAVAALPVEGSMTWYQMRDELFRTLWTLWGSEGVLKFSERFKIGKTTVFRKLRDLGIPLPSHNRATLLHLNTVADIQAEIESLQARLAALQAEGVAA